MAVKPLILTARQAEVLDAICELGETDLVAYKLKIKKRTVDHHVRHMLKTNKYPNRLTLALARDRETRK